MRWQKCTILDDQPKEVFSVRSEVVQRLLAQKCELCGSEAGPFQVHHVRKLADLDKPGHPQPAWDQLMAKKRRKSLIVCADCHAAIHGGQPTATPTQ